MLRTTNRLLLQREILLTIIEKVGWISHQHCQKPQRQAETVKIRKKKLKLLTKGI